MRTTPRISAIVTSYNGERYLREAIESLLCQTFQDFELIIVNDGSEDGTGDVINSIYDERIRIITNERNLGIGASENRGIAAARGEYVALQDHDDVSEPERFTIQLDVLESNSTVCLVGSNCIRIDVDGRPIRYWQAPLKDIDIKWQMIFRQPLCHTSLMMRRTAIDQLGGYSLGPSYRYAEDFEFLSRLTTAGEFVTIERPLVRWREHASSVSVQNNQIQLAACRSIALRNIGYFLGERDLTFQTLSDLQLLLYSRVGDPVSISTENVRDVLNLLRSLLCAFYNRYLFSAEEIDAHQKRLVTLWGKHCLALALRGNGRRDLSCRATLLLEGLRLLAKTVAPGRPDREDAPDNFPLDSAQQRKARV